MFLRKQNILIVMLTLLVFAGQAVASAVNTCQKDIETGDRGYQTQLANEHSAHATLHKTQASDKEEISTENCVCCDLDCYCPMGSCVSIAMSTLYNGGETLKLSKKIERLPSLVISQTIPSLFRPPIS